MNNDFFDKLTARLTELTADLRYLHKPSGELRPPQIIGVMLDRPTGTVAEADEYPYVRWAVYAGGFSPQRPQPFSVRIDAGIYTDGSIADGNAAILELTTALGKIVGQRSFAPSKLSTPVEFTIGDNRQGDEGLQPHPYYLSKMILNFTTA